MNFVKMILINFIDIMDGKIFIVIINLFFKFIVIFFIMFGVDFDIFNVFF